MPDRCVVPGCRSNCGESFKLEGYVSSYRFPKDPDLRSKWIRSISRSDWLPTTRSVVCMKHFQDSDLSFIEKYIDKDKNTCFRKREHPVLCQGAVPKLFLNLPSYRRSRSRNKRKNLQEKREEIYIRQRKQKENQQKQADEENHVKDSPHFSDKLSGKVSAKNWGLCAIAMAPSDTAGPQGAQFVHQPQVQQLVFEAQPHTENGFYLNSLALTGAGWVFADPKQQAILPASNNSLLQNLLEQPQNSLSPVLNQSNDPATKQVLVMLPNGEQQLVKLEVPNEALTPSQMSSEIQLPENILPTIDQNVEDMFVKQMAQHPAEEKHIMQNQCVPVIKEEASSNHITNGERLPSPSSDIVVLKELKPPSAEYVKRDPLEQSEPESPSATQVDGDVFLLNSQIKARFRPVRNKLIGEDNLEPSVVEDTKFPESQEVPKYLEIMAVCTHCGYTSMDFNRCQRCKRKLPAQVKTVPVSKNTTAEAPVSNPEVKIRKCDCGSEPMSDDWNKCGEKKASKVTRSEKPTPAPQSYLKADVIKMAAREHLDAMAVCSYCGYTSVDTELCERCKRILPENVKFVLTPRKGKKTKTKP